MNKLLTLGVGVIFFCLVSCQTNEVEGLVLNEGKLLLTSQELLSIEIKTSPELSQTELYDLIKEFQTGALVDKPNTKGKTEITSFEIKSKYYLGQNNNLSTKSTQDADIVQIPVYEVVFSSGSQSGLAIVSADRRSPHVLAIIDKIKEDETELSAGPNALVQWAEMYVRSEVESFEAIKDSVYVSAISKINKELDMDIEDINYGNIKDKILIENTQTRSTPIDEVPSNLVVRLAIFPMCPSTWGQWEPYNSQLAKSDCEKFPGWVEYTNCPAGIGAVALAHLMACTEPDITAYGTKINWASLTENKKIVAPDYFNPGDPLVKRNMVGYLFKLIYAQTKSTLVRNSKGVVTGTSCTVPDWENYLRTVLNCGGTSAWNTRTITNSLKNNRPVYVAGKPDNVVSTGVYPFILDGYKECRGRINNVPQDIDVKYIHANFGFGDGYQDGYYLMDIDKETITFETAIPLIFKEKALTMIPDIRKK